MKKSALVLISLLTALAVFLSACGFGELFAGGPSGSGQVGVVEAQPTTLVEATPVSLLVADTPPAAAPEQKAGRPASPPGNNRPHIVLVGAAYQDAPQAAALVATARNFQVTINTPLEETDLALFFVTAPDGVMPGTVQAIEDQVGHTLRRAAFFLTAADQMRDAELQELVIREYRDLMALYLPGSEAESWQVLRSNDTDFSARLAALLVGPEMATALQPREQIASPTAAPTPTRPKRIVLVGDRSAADRAVPLVQAAGEVEVEVDSVIDPSDLVLFVASAVDGATLNTTTEIDNRRGEPFPRAAFLLVDDDQNADPELRALVFQEYRAMMAGFLPGGEAERWPVLLSHDPDLASQIQGLLDSPENYLVLQ